MTSTPSTQSPSPTRGADQSALLSCSGSGRWPRSTTEHHAGDLRGQREDGCAVDDWDAMAQGTPWLGYTVSHEAILSSVAMDAPPVFRTEVMCQNVPSLDEPVSPLAWSSCADPAQTITAPSAFTDHEPENQFA
jgi:hypothetical protein